MRVVFDTNVYIAAAVRHGYAWEQLTRSAPAGPYQLFISPEIILQVREKLEGRFEWPPDRAADFLDNVMDYAVLVQPRRRVSSVLEDADDHSILECGLAAAADAIVSLDQDLLRLKTFEDIAMFHPSMLQYLR